MLFLLHPNRRRMCNDMQKSSLQFLLYNYCERKDLSTAQGNRTWKSRRGEYRTKIEILISDFIVECREAIAHQCHYILSKPNCAGRGDFMEQIQTTYRGSSFLYKKTWKYIDVNLPHLHSQFPNSKLDKIYIRSAEIMVFYQVNILFNILHMSRR